MRTKTIKKNVARAAMTLLLAMLTTTAWAEDFITDVMLIGGNKDETDALKESYGKQGWIVIDNDLNAGAKGDYIYLLYKMETNTDGYNYGYVTGFYLQNKGAANTSPTLSYNGHVYNLVSYDGGDHFKGQKGDLNSNTGWETDAIHLFYTKDIFSDNSAVTGISFNSNRSGAVGKNGGSPGYDLNANAGGKEIYMHYTTATTVPLFSGEGTTSNPFLISSTDDWNNLAACVNRGLNADRCYSLTADISVSTMVGKGGYPFCGTFDGNGKTITVDINSPEEATAPFSSVKDGFIENLTVAGNVSSSAYHTSGLVGGCGGNSVIRNCNVAATVNSNEYAGGFVGHGGDGNTLIIENCVFSGTISGFNKFAGGLLGWCDNLTLKVSNCLFKGAFAPASGGKFHPIALKWDKGVVDAIVTDTYYLNTVSPSANLGNYAIAGAQGEPVSASLVEGEWDRAVTAADGNTYYAKDNRVHLPYSCGFENGLEGWTMLNCHENSGVTTTEKRNGSNSFYFYDCELDQYLISPELYATSPVEMRFWIKGRSENLAGFCVGVSTTTSDLSAFTWGERQIGTISNWSEVVARITSEVKYIAIHYFETSSQLFLDDFTFVEPYPNPANLKMDELTAHTAKLSWEAAPNANVLRYIYRYQKTGDEQWLQTTTTNTSATLTGLEAETEYEFRVKAVYDGDEESNYMAAIFTTKSEVMPLPFEEGFENGMGGWKTINCDENSGISTDACLEGSNGFKFAKSDNQQCIISPRLEGNEPMRVTFWFRNADSNSSANFYVGNATELTNSGMSISGRVTASGGEWKQGVVYCPVGTKYFFIIYDGSDDALYLDGFYFCVGKKVVKGDANDDGEVNSEDLVEMINAIAGHPSENFNLDNADLNEDKIITVADIVLLVNDVLGK
ncbi:MAG: fibronectin type III domain-containing protein [Prevotella sp.]|nr:fibronectin type III domain-containing protein [Prevotella sp.]